MSTKEPQLELPLFPAIKFLLGLNEEASKSFEHDGWPMKDFDHDRWLIESLKLCGTVRPLPDWFPRVLFDLQIDRLMPHKTLLRWLAVLIARNEGRKLDPKSTWSDAYKKASQWLEGTDAQGAPHTMRTPYRLGQTVCRKAQNLG